jgi:hypothetical protein
MHGLQLQPGVKQRRACAVAAGEKNEVRDVDDARQSGPKRGGSGSLERETPQVAPCGGFRPVSAAPDTQRFARLFDDGAHDREAARRPVAGQDRRADEGDRRKPSHEFIEPRR